ncbi:hypothetical protein V2J09_015494 [Rumex salicifolius]
MGSGCLKKVGGGPVRLDFLVKSDRESMAKSRSVKWRLIWPFISILLIHVVAILFFTRGFLLTRTELPHHSNCNDISLSTCSSSSPPLAGGNSTGATCWTKPVVRRIVIIKKPWMDHLKIIQNLASEPGSSAKIFKAIADPPTTSLQRLKGLTTGGLPTFIDVGNSFGAPAIVEDNLIQQLVQNGKKVIMMGDDTWLQLFPHHFEKSFPYPSFNVKDLDTVDNGCIEHLLPSLHEGNWDVLIAHFLGVDHAGHIFGVNTIPMIQKLEQYNNILKDVVEAMESQSGPGELHENTLLLVMGDHGQTLNGDHGGGSPEEVETSIFAKSFKRLPFSLPSELDTSSCGLNSDGKQICTSTIEQLDFAATVSAMLGVPFPFGSIGRVNPELYALGAGAFFMEDAHVGDCKKYTHMHKWLRHYMDVLCINAWQVKRYIDVYSTSSVIGFPPEDLLHVSNMFSQAQDNLSHVKSSFSCKEGSHDTSLLALKTQINAYLRFLSSVIDLARSKWTEFDLKLMSVGLSILFVSLLLHLTAIKRLNQLCGSSFMACGSTQISMGLIFSVLVVLIRACSFLSNMEEGKVAIFFLGTIWITELRHSIMKRNMLSAAMLSIFLVYALRITMELGLSKEAAKFLAVSWLIGSTEDHPIWILSLLVPVLTMIFLAYTLYNCFSRNYSLVFHRICTMGTCFCYLLIAAHWILECKPLALPFSLQHIGKDYIPRLVYIIGCIQLVLLTLDQFFRGKHSDCRNELTAKTISMLSASSPTIVLLSGKQGPLIALASIVAVWCIIRLENLIQADKPEDLSNFTFYSSPVTQWSLLAVTLFFCTGHWCAFDGLRYGAAFIGFDEFNIVRQAVLLAIDTFGFSHILPILGIPLLVCYRASNHHNNPPNLLFAQLSLVFLIYGLITATAATFTILCVTIQRRHLMVWGLFAPKFVFDAIGLILTDVLICLASLYYIDPEEEGFRNDKES